ncbi:hypothetical protein, partial [Streptomyces sp. NPDC097981]|uniref:hypothetical protein n=1 Tax=Streptomyces sp. NPDC097981 TaxID=3155428 RepID=UPI003321E5E3
VSNPPSPSKAVPEASALSSSRSTTSSTIASPDGDDDEDDELEAAFPGEEDPAVLDEDDYYADVWETR